MVAPSGHKPPISPGLSNSLAGWERYIKFILDLYRAEPVTGFKMLHGKKARASVHAGSVDSPITMREIRETLKEAKDTGIREVHFLGWDFEMGLHDLTKEIEEDYGVKPRLISIPKEALEVKDPAKEQIRFFDLNYLELSHEIKGKKLTVTIKDFIIANPEYLPDEVRDNIKKFTDYIDYWAVDWDYKDDTFHNGWQSFRTRKNSDSASCFLGWQAPRRFWGYWGVMGVGEQIRIRKKFLTAPAA